MPHPSHLPPWWRESPSPLKSIQKLTSCNFRKSKENQTQTHQKRVTKLSKTCPIYLAHILPPRVTRAVCQVILPSSPWQVCIWICVVGLGPGILSPCMRWLLSMSISWGPFCKPSSHHYSHPLRPLPRTLQLSTRALGSGLFCHCLCPPRFSQSLRNPLPGIRV